MHSAEVALVVKDEYQNMGVGHDMLLYPHPPGQAQGPGWDLLLRSLVENKPMLDLFKNMGSGYAKDK